MTTKSKDYMFSIGEGKTISHALWQYAAAATPRPEEAQAAADLAEMFGGVRMPSSIGRRHTVIIIKALETAAVTPPRRPEAPDYRVESRRLLKIVRALQEKTFQKAQTFEFKRKI